ncbi:MAG: GNAT family N-acetyltransferase [Azoarcus sp.]|jgi:GNAT superfamily N-acetyltransferase|nr:GNAT family N-acetyltransferase [Azoarcus sp.]
MPLALLCVTDDAGRIAAPEWLARALLVHRQLHENLPPEADAYRQVLQRVCADGGRLTLAVEDEAVRGLALWRVVENTHEGRRFYVNDLVTEAACRGRGVGKALVGWLEDEARRRGCAVLALDSGVTRHGAHHFYFREGFFIPAFCFRKLLK